MAADRSTATASGGDAPTSVSDTAGSTGFCLVCVPIEYCAAEVSQWTQAAAITPWVKMQRAEVARDITGLLVPVLSLALAGTKSRVASQEFALTVAQTQLTVSRLCKNVNNLKRPTAPVLL